MKLNKLFLATISGTLFVLSLYAFYNAYNLGIAYPSGLDRCFLPYLMSGFITLAVGLLILLPKVSLTKRMLIGISISLLLSSLYAFYNAYNAYSSMGIYVAIDPLYMHYLPFLIIGVITLAAGILLPIVHQRKKTQ